MRQEAESVQCNRKEEEGGRGGGGAPAGGEQPAQVRSSGLRSKCGPRVNPNAVSSSLVPAFICFPNRK